MVAYRAPSLFQPHRARQALRDAHEGKIPPMIGLYLGLSSIPIVRLLAPMGFDAVWIDWEHTSCNVETMTTVSSPSFPPSSSYKMLTSVSIQMVHEVSFISEGRSIPFVRLPGHDHAAIGYALDAGASIVIPQVDTVEQARHVISAAKFGTRSHGTRSAPPFRLLPGLTDNPINPAQTIFENLNDQAAIVIQIESLTGINNLDAILTACPEIDACWLGTIDARVSMNLNANTGQGAEPEWLEAVAKYESVMAKHDKPKGAFAIGPDEVVQRMGRNKAMVFSGVDVVALAGLYGTLMKSKDLFPPLVASAKPNVANGVADGLP